MSSNTIRARLKEEMKMYQMKKQLLYMHKQIEQLTEEKAEFERKEAEEKRLKESTTKTSAADMTKQELDNIAVDLGFESYDAISISDVVPVKESNTGGIIQHVR